jgi:hypothetical protein
MQHNYERGRFFIGPVSSIDKTSLRFLAQHNLMYRMGTHALPDLLLASTLRILSAHKLAKKAPISTVSKPI